MDSDAAIGIVGTMGCVINADGIYLQEFKLDKEIMKLNITKQIQNTQTYFKKAEQDEDILKETNLVCADQEITVCDDKTYNA